MRLGFAARSVPRNFGDELSRLVVEYFTGRRVRWAPSSSASLVGIGSVAERFLGVNPEGQVFGSGAREFRRDPSTAAVDPARILAVRGELTRDFLRLPAGVPLGDPGLAVSDLVPRNGRRRGVVVIPHFRTYGSAAGRSQLARLVADGCEVVAPSRSPLEVATRAARSDLVVTSSLHGLVVANATSVPAILVRFASRTQEPDAKYADYLSAFSRKPRWWSFDEARKMLADRSFADAVEERDVITSRLSGVLEGLHGAARGIA
ncbi:polysaccharide pyruvyl transferase family protein [Cellulomonas fimi]|uniref:polysaccharide pyruvyl transferase family protein n=1 Tax=Cellulomonas fimi TaxID=1708 RepID=UPI0023581871|nr:polysaccharide pyruvyl transferase family protein [Cellulomonas fimi]